MRYPPRFSHLVTRSVVVAKLTPMCAKANGVDDEVAEEKLQIALKGALHEEVLGATWRELTSPADHPADDALLETIAGVLKKRGEKPGAVTKVTPAWNAFMVLVDVRAGTSTGAAQKLLDSDQGKQLVASGLVEVGRLLANELTTLPPPRVKPAA
jgi:hypothetical protein